jgi:hypothetical protein
MGSNPVGDTMRRVLLVLLTLAACRHSSWTVDPELQVYAKPYRSAYASVDELAIVAPGLDVRGAMKDSIATKLAAAGVGKDGHVLVELGDAAPTGSGGSLAVHVHINAAWGTGAGKLVVDATIVGAIRYAAAADAFAGMTEVIADRLASQIETIVVPSAPKRVVALHPPATPIAVGVGSRMSCSLHADGTVRCWGDAPRLGPVPMPIAGVANAVELAVGDQIGCARLVDGTAACWDPQAWPATIDALPAKPVCGTAKLRAIAATAALGEHSVATWTRDPSDCANVAQVEIGDAIALRASSSTTCVLDRARHVSCWSAGGKPADIPTLAGASAISVTGDRVCGALAAAIRCTGEPDRAHTGIAQLSGPLARTQAGTLIDDGDVVTGIDHVRDVAATRDGRACAITTDDVVSCRGPDRKPFVRVVYGGS